MKTFAPDYYPNFACSGSDCSYDCCHDLLIKINEKTYEDYLKLDNIEIKEKVLESIEITNKDPFTAFIKLTEKGDCPFLLANGLCKIQLACGHESLSYACQKYPRIFCNVGDDLETFMSMGCEAAAKQALFNAEMMTLAEVKLDFDYKIVYGNVLEPEKYTTNKNALAIFWKLRNLSVLILQLRKHKLWLRVVMLGFFIQMADKLLAEGKEDEIIEQAEEYIKSVEAENYDEYKNMIPDWYDIKISNMHTLFETLTHSRREKKRDHLNICFDQVKEGLGIVNEDTPVQEVVDNFIAARDLYYTSFFANQEYVLENYLVNTVLATGFPFKYRGEKNMYDNFVRLAIRYSLIKFLLIGMAGYHKADFNQEIVIKTITAFSRLFDHNNDLSDAFLYFFNNSMSTEMGTLCVLVKD
jgi:lysine-N-methylase